MQTRKFSRITVVLAVLVLCISIFAVPVSASETEETVPSFVLCFDTPDGGLNYAAFCVRSGDSVYLMASAEAGAAAQSGSEAALLGIGYTGEAVLLKTVGQISYFRAPGLESVAAYETGTEFPNTVVVAALVEEEGERYVGLSDPVLMDEGWKDQGSYYLSEDIILEDTVLVGAPVLSADGTQLVGMVARNSAMNMVILPLIGNTYPADATVVSMPSEAVSGTPEQPQEDGSEATGQTEQPEEGAQEEKEPVPVQTMLLVGGGILLLLAVIVAANRKTKKKESAGAASAGGGFQGPAPDAFSGGTIALKRNEMASELVDIQPTAALSSGAAAGPARWQLRCIRGTLEGKTYPLTGTLSIGRAPDNEIAFSESTKGVSAKHCEVQLSGGRVILRDLNSTYGTYFGMESRAKLQPNMEYTVKNGDVFILAEGGPAFRLEPVGGPGKRPGFTVRSAGGTLYRANADGEITFGRNPECVAGFDRGNSSISGRHCKLFAGEDGLFLMDQGSTNGTYFEQGQRLKPNVSYKVTKGARFYLVSPDNAFEITEV